MLTLHYYPGNASMTPHIVLEELGVPYQRVLVDRTQDAHRQPAYLKLNPNGQIPVLTDGDLVLYETAAICLHLCDTHPQAQLAPPLGTAARAHFYKWLAWLTNTMQATLMIYFYPERWLPAGDVAGAANLKANAQARVVAMFDQLQAQLQSHGGPWLLGADHSVLDPYAMMLCRWTRGFEHPARSLPSLKVWLDRVLERPAVQRVFATEGLPRPWV